MDDTKVDAKSAKNNMEEEEGRDADLQQNKNDMLLVIVGGGVGQDGDEADPTNLATISPIARATSPAAACRLPDSNALDNNGGDTSACPTAIADESKNNYKEDSNSNELKRLTQKVTTLQNKSNKTLRGMFGFKKRDLQQKQLETSASPEQRDFNDKLAAVAMLGHVHEILSPAQLPMTSYSSDAVLAVAANKQQQSAPPMASSASPGEVVTSQGHNMPSSSVSAAAMPSPLPSSLEFDKKTKSYQPRKTRRELLEEVEGLQELITELTIRNPSLQTRVLELASSNPKLQHVELLSDVDVSQQWESPTKTTAAFKLTPVSGSGGIRKRLDLENSSAMNVVGSNVRLIRGGGGSGGGGFVVSTPMRKRKESEKSNASTNTSQKDLSITANCTSEETSKKSRKRGGRGKNKNISNSKDGKTNNPLKGGGEISEKQALAKYINTIVVEHMSGPGADPAKNLNESLIFSGGVDDLEAHAQLLVAAGLGRIVEDEIRVNRKNNRQSFITMSADREGRERDGIILLPVARRYAFEGDVVRAFVMNAGSGGAAGSVGAMTPVTTDAQKRKKSKDGAITGGQEHSFFIADNEEPFANDTDDMPDSDDVEPTDELDISAVVTPDNCPKAFVISIVKQTDQRQIVGTIYFANVSKLNDDEPNGYYKLKPHDMRVPMVYIPEKSVSAAQVTSDKNDICGFLYLAMVRETDPNGRCIGELLEPVGKVGNLEAEIKAILLHNGLKEMRPYEERFNDLFAQPDPAITAKDLDQREDLRKKCVFTIDPLTARDLDDAVSVVHMTGDQYEVGVHISDVAHYLHEDTELDNIVKNRATSVYLVNEVIHMLPKPLCFKCSLLPGEDKFAFSVFWRMNLHGEVLGAPRFTRSVINSCSQFAYEHAQKIIDNPKEQFGEDDFPTICNGFTPVDIAWRVRILHAIAQQLRKKRYDSGALSINNPKLRFNVHPKTGEPLSYEVEGRQEANFLIEEFMLLANQSVARFIHDRFPDISILRNHAPPLTKSMKILRDKLAALGIEFDFTTSKTVYESMQRICLEAKDPQAMDACLSTMLTKPMARAKYFCSEGKSDESDLWHYALSIPIYTHFTSPIRRYPDILVHRLLAAALNYCPPPKRTVEELHHMAKVCNDQKFNAKSAGDESTNLFFKRYIRAKQSITLRAVVTEIFNHLINVVTIETGHAIAINYKIQKVLVNTSGAPAYILISEKNSSCQPVKLQLFSTVDVKIVVWDDRICGFFVSPDLKQRQLNSIESSKKKQQQLPSQQQKQQPTQTTNGVEGVTGASTSSNGEHDASTSMSKKKREKSPRRNSPRRRNRIRYPSSQTSE